jgi:hypothetical protein
VGDNRRQHLIEIQAGADRLTDCSESLQLIHLASEFGGACPQGLEQVDVADGDGRLGREGGQELDGALTEGVDLGCFRIVCSPTTADGEDEPTAP